MSRHSEIYDYINTKLNSNTNNLTFKLFYKYTMQGQEFQDLLLQSVDNPSPNEENEVDVMLGGVTYSTQNGVYTLENVNYIPCIIEGFGDEFQPLETNIDTIIKYRVPVSFFIDERFNRNNSDIVEEAIESVQDLVRGSTDTIGGFNMFISHGAFEPQTGLVMINEVPYRKYQLIFFFKATKRGSFAKQIQTHITNTNLFAGQPTRVYPISRSTPRVNELIPRQKFETDTDTTEVYEVYSIPDISAFELELTFVYKNDEFTRHFLDKRYAPTKPEIYTISTTMPGYEGNVFSNDFLIESINGPEEYSDQMFFTVVFKKASVKYNG